MEIAPRIVAGAQLQRERTLGGIVGQQAFPVAAQRGAGRDHFGVEQGASGQQPQEKPAVPRTPSSPAMQSSLGHRGAWVGRSSSVAQIARILEGSHPVRAVDDEERDDHSRQPGFRKTKEQHIR